MMFRILLTLLPLSAAAIGGGHVVNGKVAGGAAEDYTWLRVVVRDANSGEELGSSAVAGDGSFVVKQLPEVIAEVAVLTPHGDTASKRYLNTASRKLLVFQLPSSDDRTAGISMYRMGFKVGEAAKNEWIRALAALRGHDRRTAYGHLSRAVELEPDFADAHEHLGLLALSAGSYPTARDHLEKAARLDSGNTQFLSNAALACLASGLEKDAEKYARAALRLSPGNERPLFILGLALFHQSRNLDEAESALSAARQVFPDANRFLLLLRRRQEAPSLAGGLN
jgi:tetratricopeptide (TPR) repeat protein